MKRLLLLFTFCFAAISLNAQKLDLLFEVNNNAGGGVANYPVWIYVFSSGSSQVLQGYTNANGQFYDSIIHPGTANIEYLTYDCQGNQVWGDNDNITSSNLWTGDTVILNCISSITSCQARYRSMNSPAGLTIGLQDSSNYIPASGSTTRQIWNWGDGSIDTTTGLWNLVNHTYAQAGAYQVSMEIYQADTFGTSMCYSTFSDTIAVSGSGNPTNFCNASYWLDTNSSGGSSVVIVNNSNPAYADPAYSNTYSWTFGDGATSNQPYPVHNYSAPGAYPVCVSITSINTTGDTCIDTYCDTLGVDSLGNLVYKSTSGFTLKVIDPASVGMNENQIGKVSIYPNPADEALQVDLGASEGGMLRWNIYDMKGTSLSKGAEALQSGKLSLDVSDLAPGVYIISLETAQQQINKRLLID
ncbi:MAG: PKD domain-containing protein [Owenweeksia sp.]|nr:PKD domain-containing protein [Owenweeksia sp.]